MKKVSLSGSLRGNVGKKDAKALRNQGLVPCVIYGGQDQVHFNLSDADFRTILFTPETFLIEITIDGKVFKTILKDVQYHPVGDQVLHADFYEITANKPVTVALPVKLTGTSPGVIQGGRLKLKIRKLKLKAMLEDMPEEVVVSIAKLKIGQSVKVKDIKLPKVTILDPAGSVVVDVKTARGLTAAELEEEEAAEGAEGAPAEGETKE